jgi:alkylation response protein AidB-like acyl-CoA dehydrogenase
MDLTYGPEYESFRTNMRDFLAAHRHAAPAAATQKDPKSQAWQRLLIQHGYAARTIPTQYGGAGHTPTSSSPASSMRNSPPPA